MLFQSGSHLVSIRLGLQLAYQSPRLWGGEAARRIFSSVGDRSIVNSRDGCDVGEIPADEQQCVKAPVQPTWHQRLCSPPSESPQSLSFPVLILPLNFSYQIGS